MPSFLPAVLSVVLVAGSTAAASAADVELMPVHHETHPWQLSFAPPDDPFPVAPAIVVDVPREAAVASEAAGADEAAQPARRRPVAIEYSDGYRLRQRIHKYSSFATLPLFGAELALGQSLYNSSANAGAKRAAHAWIGGGIVGLFAVNTVTGAWNMFGEGRKDPNGRTLRLVHGLLMMAADVGFLATTASGPSSESERHAFTFEGDKVTHRNIAIASMSVGTLGYLIMLLGNR